MRFQYCIASALILIKLFIFPSKIIAQEKVSLNYREIDNHNCRNAIQKAKNKLKSYNLNVYTMKLKTSDFYENVPIGLLNGEV